MSPVNGAVASVEVREVRELDGLVAAWPGFKHGTPGKYIHFRCPVCDGGEATYYQYDGALICQSDARCRAADIEARLRGGAVPINDPTKVQLREEADATPTPGEIAKERKRLRIHKMAVEAEAAVEGSDDSAMRVSGGALFDTPLSAPIWGHLGAPLSAEGQGWMIVGPDGTGKTSVTCQYVKTRLGMYDEMWGLPVVPLPEDRSVYYLAMDRPRQMMAAFMRGVGPEHREMLDRRLFVHKGPPPYLLSHDRGQRWFLDEVEETGAGLVVFDSRKDLGSTVDAESVTGIATMVQVLVAAEIDVLVLAHPHKGRRNGPPSLEDVSGHREVFSGLGSVLFLDGSAGKPLVQVHQVKPIQEIHPPLTILHDHRAGLSDVAVGLVPSSDDGVLVGGRVPVDGFELRVLACIDAHPDAVAPSASLKEVLKSDNLSRDLKYLIEKQVIEHNGRRGPQAGYTRGSKAPPRATGDR